MRNPLPETINRRAASFPAPKPTIAHLGGPVAGPQPATESRAGTNRAVRQTLDCGREPFGDSLPAGNRSARSTCSRSDRVSQGPASDARPYAAGVAITRRGPRQRLARNLQKDRLTDIAPPDPRTI